MDSKPALFLTTALIALGSGAVGAILTQRMTDSAVAGAQTGGVDSRALDALRSEIASLREERAGELRELDALRGELRLAQSATERAPAELPSAVVGAAVDRWLAERGIGAQAGGADASPAAASDAAAGDDGLPATVEGIVALLANPDLSDMERQEIWQKLRDAKRLDPVVEWFEKNAAEHATDPDAQVQAGEAYVAKILEVGNGPMAGVWATKADGAWDAALEIDPAHWDARFAKAIGLSFWPPIFGKQPEAIRQFEVLLGYQEQAPQKPSHEQTYLMLGNLYAQAGRADDAQAMWKKGLALFPDSDDLKAKLQ